MNEFVEYSLHNIIIGDYKSFIIARFNKIKVLQWIK